MDKNLLASNTPRLLEKLFVGIIGKPSFCHLITRELKNHSHCSGALCGTDDGRMGTHARAASEFRACRT